MQVDAFRRRMEELLDEVFDPDDPKRRRKKTRPSGPSGGPPTRLWAKRPSGMGCVRRGQSTSTTAAGRRLIYQEADCTETRNDGGRPIEQRTHEIRPREHGTSMDGAQPRR